MNAIALEAAVRTGLTETLNSDTELIGDPEAWKAADLRRLRPGADAFAAKVATSLPSTLRVLLIQCELQVQVYEDRLEASVARERVIAQCIPGIVRDEGGRIEFCIPASLRRYGHETRLRVDAPLVDRFDDRALL